MITTTKAGSLKFTLSMNDSAVCQPRARTITKRSGTTQMPKTASTSPKKCAASALKLCSVSPGFERVREPGEAGRQERVQDRDEEDRGRDEVQRLGLRARGEHLEERKTLLPGIAFERGWEVRHFVIRRKEARSARESCRGRPFHRSGRCAPLPRRSGPENAGRSTGSRRPSRGRDDSSARRPTPRFPSFRSTPSDWNSRVKNPRARPVVPA